MKIWTFFLLFLACVTLQAGNPRYYLEFNNPKIENGELSFSIKIFPVNENFTLLGGNIRFNLDSKITNSSNKPIFYPAKPSVQEDVLSINYDNNNSYVNLAFSIAENIGVDIDEKGFLIGYVHYKMDSYNNKELNLLVKQRVYNLSSYINPLPKATQQNCTLIFTSDSPYEPVQEGLPVNKVHFYTEQVVGSDDFQLYPNPSTGMLTYDWLGADIKKDISVKVFDNFGKLLLNRTLDQQSEGSLDITSYASGIYFLQFENGENIQRHKVIKVD
ncbi:MAG: T9SS type A sorting domain-containing protein [Saprospiraceae bacterium]|nr:T9SS type A sorting domain-containing protein [Saprospiraceae bacterium]